MQTMLTVVTQNSRLLRRSALSGDRMAGFAYPALVRARARCQVMPRPLMHNIVRIGDSFLSSVLVAFVSRKNRSKTPSAD